MIVGQPVRIVTPRSAHKGETGRVIELDDPWVIVAFDPGSRYPEDVSAGFGRDEIEPTEEQEGP